MAALSQQMTYATRPHAIPLVDHTCRELVDITDENGEVTGQRECGHVTKQTASNRKACDKHRSQIDRAYQTKRYLQRKQNTSKMFRLTT